MQTTFAQLRQAQPAVAGLYASPTVINNVETLCNVPHIIANGAGWFAGIGTEKSTGTAVFSVSGKVERPGNYDMQRRVYARTRSLAKVTGWMVDRLSESSG